MQREQGTVEGVRGQCRRGAGRYQSVPGGAAVPGGAGRHRTA